MRELFKLEMKDDAKVKNLDELRANFDVEKIAEHYKSGKLLEWLEDHFYDDEAEAVAAIQPGDDYFVKKVCMALDVECDDNLELVQRNREKKQILSEKTDDDTIIDNAPYTALDQDDLINLLHMDYKTIYLCGEQFNIPIRVGDMKYVGVLSKPKIKIKANSDEDLEAKNIVFENCKLPWTKNSPIEELRALANKIFQTNGEWYIGNVPDMTSSGTAGYGMENINSNTYGALNKNEKAIAVKMVCQGKYDESQIAYMQCNEDISDGFALTIDAFCTGGASGGNIFKYNEIYLVWIDGKSCKFWPRNKEVRNFSRGILSDTKLYSKVIKFLDVVKNF